MLLVGLALAADGGYWVVWSVIADEPSKPFGLLSRLVAGGIMVVGLLAILSGIGILRRAESARVFGILICVTYLLGTLLLLPAGLVFVPLVAFSLIVLIFNWRARTA